MTSREETVLAIAFSFAEACRECETRRVDDEPAPKPLWQAAWTRRQALLQDLMAAAQTLVTDPLGGAADVG